MTSDGRHYNPSQPRVPAGHARGGQWTSGEYGPRSEEEQSEAPRQFEDVRDETGEEPWSRRIESRDGVLTFLRDGQIVRSQHGASGQEHHSVRQPGGNVISFQQDGEQYRIYAGGELVQATELTSDGLVSLPVAQLARGKTPRQLATEKFIEAALAALAASRSTRWRQGGQIRGLSFDIDTLLAAKDGRLPTPMSLTANEAEKLCKRYGEAQTTLDRIYQKVVAMPQDWTPQTFGTHVHMEFAHDVNGSASTKKPKDPHFRSEFSLIKSLQDDPAQPFEKALMNWKTGYAFGGTARVDLFEDVDRKGELICVYDIKTGKTRLDLDRIYEIAFAVANNFRTAKQVIILEMTPAGQSWRPR